MNHGASDCHRIQVSLSNIARHLCSPERRCDDSLFDLTTIHPRMPTHSCTTWQPPTTISLDCLCFIITIGCFRYRQQATASASDCQSLLFFDHSTCDFCAIVTIKAFSQQQSVGCPKSSCGISHSNCPSCRSLLLFLPRDHLSSLFAHHHFKLATIRSYGSFSR